MKKHSSFRQLVASVLIAALLLGNAAFFDVRAAEVQELPVATETAASTGENLLELLKKEASEPELERPVDYAPTDKVTVIVELEEEPLPVETSSIQLAQVGSLSVDHSQVKAEICQITGEANAVARTATSIEKTGYDYYCVMNGFSTVIEYQYLDQIRNLDGVKRVFVERSYEAPTLEPDMNASTGMIGATEANESGYDGSGMVVAVLDTGLDVSHEAFANAPEAPKYSRDDMDGLLNTLQLSAKRVSLNRVYVSEKIPYVYDYAGMDTDVYPYGGDSHGTHVSGTVAADCDALTGVAPGAQLMMMKVFSDEGTAYDSCILAALDDAVKLGVDAINMSLGAAAGFSEAADEATREVYERIREAGINLAVSAGNNDSAAAYNTTGVDLPYATDPDYGITGAPSTYDAAMSVASAINLRIENSPYLMSNGRQIFMTDVSSAADPKVWALDGTYSYVYCGFGTPEDFETAGYVKGKVALVSRGQNNFTEKVANAYNAGAIAVLVMNNQSGSIAMAVDNYLIPAVSITQADGNFLRDRADCTVTFSPDYFGAQENAAAGQMSTFSSWGVTPDLKLKPEITAPGENIYSTSLNGTYELMSGTSMASPHIAGAFAAVKQYLVKTYPEKDAGEIYDLANALLMSTATPTVDPDGQYYSPRKQGAGLANISDAINAQAYLSVSTSSKPKAELGDSEEGSYTFEVQLHNLSSEAKTYTVEISALIEQVSDGLFTGYSVDYAGNGISTSCTQDCVTVPANGDATVTVTLQVSPELRAQVFDLAPSGTYVDGFVRFLSEDNVDLTLPYLAFLGDWAEASVFDTEYNTGDYHLRPSIVFNAVSNNMTFLGQNIIYNLLTGETLVDPDRYVISPNSYMDFCSILSTQTGLLRSARKLTYTVTPKDSDEVLREFSYDGVMKSYYYQSYGLYTWAEAFVDSIPYFDGYDENGKQVPEGIYTYTVRAWIDGAGDQDYQDWSFDFAYDATPAQVEDYTLYEADGHSYLRLVVSDNFFLSGLQLSYDDEHFAGSMAVLDPDLNEDGTYAVDEDGNRLYTVEFDVTDLFASLKAEDITPTTLTVDLFDYALNLSSVTLKIADAVPETVTLDRNAVQLVPGMTTTLKATVAPADAVGYTLSWSSSDSSVATVDENGLVTAVKEGTAEITVKAGDASAVCVVTVSAQTGIAIDPTEYTLTEGETLTFQASLLSGYGTAVFTSSNETVASVTENGVLTAKAPGDVIITAASSVDSRVTATAFITVVSANPNFVITDGVLTSYTGQDTEIVIPNTVTEIGANVLGWGSTVRKVIIPASVTKIDSSAFSYCSSLEEVVIQGNGLEEIGSYAFSSTALTEIALPASVETIGYSAFSYCSELQRVELASGGLTYLGSYAFAGTSLYEIDIPDTVTYIGDYCFSETYLMEVEVPNSVEYLGSGAFFYCLYLQRAVLPESLETLKRSTFWWCVSLTELELPKDLKTLEQSAIYGTSLQTLDLPATLETIEAYALGDNLFTRIVLPANVKTLGDNALQGNTAATEIVLNEKLETMGNNVFQACYALEKLYIGEALSSVGTNLFQYCTRLAEITVNVNNPYFKAENCVLYSKDGKILYSYAPGSTAQSFTIPVSVEEIRPYAFSDQMDLETVILPQGLKTIGQEAFARMENLRAIAIPDSVTSLASKAFTDCPALETVQIGSGVTEIPSDCFKNAYSLQSLSLGSGIRTIQSNAFSNADSLENLVVPEGVESIGSNAFMGSDSLRTVLLPASLNSLSNSAFNFCDSLEAFDVASGSTSYASKDGVLFTAGYEMLMSYPAGKPDKAYTTPDGVKTVNGYAFYQTKCLEELTLSKGVTTLEDYAIYYCDTIRVLNLPDSLETVGFLGVAYTGIETLTFGTNLRSLGMMAFCNNTRLRLVDMSRCENLSLGGSAFYGCFALNTVIGGKGVTSLSWSVFGYPETATVYAPTGSALLNYAINNGMPYVVCNGLTVIPDLAQTSVVLGGSLDVSLYTIGAVGDVEFTWTLTHQATGETILTQAAEGNPFTVTPPCAGVLALTVNAKDSTGAEAASLPVTITVGDGTTPSYDWKTGAYVTTAYLYDLQQQELLPETSTLGPVLLTVDSRGLTATLTIDGATAFGVWDAAVYTEVSANSDGTFTLPLPAEQSTLTVTIAYGEKEVVGVLKLDLAGAVYQQPAQEAYTLTDGYYETEAVFYYNDWDQVSPATAFLKAAYLQVQNGVCSVILEIQPWTQEDGTVVNLQGLSLITASGVIPVVRVEGENGSVYFRATLPAAVDYTDVLLEYNDVSGTVDLPRVAKLWLDFANAEPSEHITDATELRDTKKPTCTEDGYTGDTYCAICGELLSRGEVIPALGHDYVYVNQKMPTFTENGYSGDLVCSRCGHEKEHGHVIPATGSLIGIITTPTTPVKPSTSMDYTDVSTGDWFYDAVRYVYDEGLMNGTGSGKFSPYSTLTRAMVVTILYRMEGEPSTRYNGMFPDVANYQWYTDGVEWAAKNNIVTGYTTGKFGPEDPVTREQLAAILYRYAQSKGYDVSASADLSGCTDGTNVSSYAVSAVKWAVAKNILAADNGKLQPRDAANRAQVALAVANFHQQYIK